MADNALADSASVRAAAEAALGLHEPQFSAEDIRQLLIQLVNELDLADSVTFVPDTSVAAGQEPDDHGLVGIEVTRSLPTSKEGGGLEGVLWCRPRSPDARAGVEVLAAHAGAALAMVARREDVERREHGMRRVAERLQDAMLPELPDVAHTRLTVEYRAAGRETRVGGDFYDVFPLPWGSVLVVVGDVQGKGIEAASRTLLVTQTFRALALQGASLEELLERADDQVRYQDPEFMATVWCGLYQPATGEMRFASLGHPPALLLRAQTEPTRLELEGLPLGLRDLADEPPETRSRRLAPRDLLVLYTDGVVEASGDLVSGQEHLMEVIGRHREEPLQSLVASTLDELLAEGGHTDDAAMLLLRRL